MNKEALKYLKDIAGLEPEYGTVEITCEGIADHMTMFSYTQNIKLKDAITDVIGLLGEDWKDTEEVEILKDSLK